MEVVDQAKLNKVGLLNFTCNICFNTFNEDKRVNLECDHSFDSECIVNLIKFKINENNFDNSELSCPDCNKIISGDIIKSLVNDETYKKYNRRLLLDSSNTDKNQLEIPEITEKCPNCNNKVHDFSTCEENENKLNSSLIFAKAIIDLGYKPCPTCKAICEKVSGCKFMKCYSTICKGKNNFCYLCGKSILDKHHHSHYRAKGPFGDICNTMDGNIDDNNS